MAKDLLFIFYSIFLILILQLTVLPYFLIFLKDKLIDHGYAFAKMAALLLVSLIIWFLAHFQLPINSQLGVYAVMIALGYFAYAFATGHLKSLQKIIEEKSTLFIAEEIIFVAFFVLMTLIRAYNPSILDLEKFMDHGLIISYSKSRTLPLMDFWLSGEKFNYYTFGHFYGSILTQIWGLKPEITYNLILGFLYGAIATEAFSIGLNLTSIILKDKQKLNYKKLFLGALVAPILVAVGGNGHAAWYFFLKNKFSFENYWYPDATRFIDRTIHEFPTYSFIVCDLHAHVFGLPVVFLLITAIFLWFKAMLEEYQQKTFFKGWCFKFAGFIGLILGMNLMISAWDLAIYGLFLVIIGLLLLVRDKKYFPYLFKSALVIGFTILITSSMWWLNFESISEGARTTNEHSPLWQLLVLWGPHVLMSSLTAILSYQLIKKQSKKDQPLLFFPLAIFATALALIIIPEFIYMKDIYPNHPRANTMFKLIFQSFSLMGLLISFFAGMIINLKLEKRWQIGFKMLLSIFMVLVLMYPFFGLRDYYGLFKKYFDETKVTRRIVRNLQDLGTDYKGLNGMYWLKEEQFSDYQAINWLNKNIKGRPVILEAVGESYTKYARVSTFTGFPTVLGWRVHEWLWRGSFDEAGKRTEEVKQVYAYPDSEEARRVLRQYKVEYIFVGVQEREAYPEMDIAKVKTLGDIIFEDGDTFILVVKI